MLNRDMAISIATLERLLSNPSKDSLNKIDSTIIYSATILKDGTLNNIKLEYGNPSKFSETVKTIFLEEPKINKFQVKHPHSTIWKSATLYSSGQNVGSKIRIYAELLSNGKVKILLTPKLTRFLIN